MKEFFNELLQKAYIYIPMVCTFITAIGLPSLVQVSKIFASASLYLTQVKYLKAKVNECVQVNNKMIDYLDQFIGDEIAYNNDLLKCTYNKQQKLVITERIAMLEKRRLDNKIFKLVEIQQLPQKAEKTKKVIVKIKNGVENAETTLDKAQSVLDTSEKIVGDLVNGKEE